jgi:hypothetical protein
MILLVDLQMLGEVVDAFGQQRHLNLSGSSVIGACTVFFYNNLGVVHEVLSYAVK